MNLTRSRAIALMGASLAIPSCSRGRPVRVGSKNFSENITIAEIYAQALEIRGKLKVERHFNLGSTQIATAALRRGDIDLYPEYTGTGLIDVLHLPPMHDPKAILATLRREYKKLFGATWLNTAPVNDSQGLAVTAATAQARNLRNLTDCARLAPQLRLAAVPEFVSRADALPGLQHYYGGFHFKEVRTYDIGLQYTALVRGYADVATAFTTDAQIVVNGLVVLRDDRDFWPPYNVAPVVRLDFLQTHDPLAISRSLNRVSEDLTDYAVRRLNLEVDVHKRDPAEVASEFLY